MPLSSDLKLINETSTILQLLQAFERLNLPADQIASLGIEKQKLYLIQLFETMIKREIPRQYTVPKLTMQPVNYSFNQTARELFYYFLLAFGLFENVAGSYLFGAALFSLIPGISNPALMIASLIFTALSSVLFYTFDVTVLKEAFGIPCSDTDFAQLIETYSIQLKTTIAINQLLSTMHVQNINALTFDEYRQLITLLNVDLRNKLAGIEPYPASLLKNILNAGMLAFGALSSIAGSYFFVNTLMMMVAASMVGTPIGWTIVALTVISGLGFYYALDAINMIQLVNPVYDSYDTLKKELELFKDHYGEDLGSVKSTKDRFVERMPTQDASTQTTEETDVSRMLFFESFTATVSRLVAVGNEFPLACRRC